MIILVEWIILEHSEHVKLKITLTAKVVYMEKLFFTVL